MTGGMDFIDPKTGEDDSGEVWGLHAAVAKAVRGKLKPFDKYQGPYIDLRDATLWLSSGDGIMGQVYDERSEELSLPFPMQVENADELAVEAARALLKRVRAAKKKTKRKKKKK